MNAEKLGFIKGELYELEKDNVRYRLPNQKLPFLKKDFHVKNSYADFMIEDIEISISIYDGKDFAIEFMMLSRLVDTFFSRTSWTMLLYAENHSISVA